MVAPEECVTERLVVNAPDTETGTETEADRLDAHGERTGPTPAVVGSAPETTVGRPLTRPRVGRGCGRWPPTAGVGLPRSPEARYAYVRAD